jgi:hypothetical protein
LTSTKEHQQHFGLHLNIDWLQRTDSGHGSSTQDSSVGESGFDSHPDPDGTILDW